MLFLFQLTSSVFYDVVFVIVTVFGLVVLFGSLVAREQKKPIRKLPKVEGVNRAHRRKELALNGRRRI